ncbi:unnamed protein product, partial [Amoebophrya sp. A120]|eukprot:GSA120T00024193001.1
MHKQGGKNSSNLGVPGTKSEPLASPVRRKSFQGPALLIGGFDTAGGPSSAIKAPSNRFSSSAAGAAHIT